jgi:predicted enzyme related to lactoylglutathione lyase
MSKLTAHDNGMPIWVDANVETPEQHHDLRAFLSALFDWTWELGGPEMGYYALASHGGAPVFGLGQGEGARGVATTYFATSAIDDSAAKAVALGASVTMPVMPVMELGSMALLVDPTGAAFGLWQPGTFQGFGVAYEANAPGWFDHVSGDPDAAATFYSELTGHQVTSPDPAMKILQNGEQWFASFSHAQTGIGPRWNPIFVVDSLERIHKTVPRLGGAIVIAEMPVPGSAICVFSEPVNGTLMTVMRGGESPG